MSEAIRARFGGLVALTLGTLLTVWMWYMALSIGQFYPKAAFIGAAMLPPGLFLVVTGNTRALNRNPLVKFGVGATSLALGGLNVFLLAS
jgi:hypothetical protein